MRLTELQRSVVENKIRRGFNTTDLGKDIICLVEEVGELAAAYRDSNQQPAAQLNNREALLDALGDIMVYCLGMIEMLGSDSEALLSKITSENLIRVHRAQVRDSNPQA